MPVEQVIRAVAIDDLAVCIQAWRWICDDCGRRDTFADIPMPEGHSEMDAQRKGWVIRWDQASDGELCRCPGCCARRNTPAITPTESQPVEDAKDSAS